STKPNSLLDVLPVRGVESPCYDQEQAKEQQHPYAQPLAEELVGFGDPAQEVRQVGNVIVERSLVRGVERVLGGFTATVVLQHLRAGFSVTHGVVRGAGTLPHGFTVLFDLVDVADSVRDRALKLPQNVGHAHTWEHGVVPACLFGGVAIEGTQEGVDVVDTG